MKWNSYVSFILAGLLFSEVSAEEVVSENAILNNDEINQHQQLALSLRNQRLLEQQAESRAKQLLFQLQAAEAWAAIQRLGVQVNTVTTADNDDSPTPDLYMSEQFDALLNFRVYAILYRNDDWLARIGDGKRVLTVRNGSELQPGIVARVEKNMVELVGKHWQHQMSME